MSTRQPRLWVDLCSPSHPFLFRSIVDALDNVTVSVTVREKTETIPLAEEMGFEYEVIGADFDSLAGRLVGVPLRSMQLAARMPPCDVVLCARNAMAVLAAKSRGIPSIHFTDNDITEHVSGLWLEQLYNQFRALASYHVVPDAFATAELTDYGVDPDSIYTYDGTKEDIYVAAFTPDPMFSETLPFDDYVVVRPEAMTAAYVDIDKSLVPQLLAAFVDRGDNVVYLPRRRGDEAHAGPYREDQVYVPEEPPNGLQLAWHADCVLTGSGTMAREAAAMDKPAVSFFPTRLLSVDDRLVTEGRMFHSRDPGDIIDYYDSITDADSDPDRDRCRRVRREVAEITAGIVNDRLD